MKKIGSLNKKTAKKTERCQICGSKNLEFIISLGHTPLVNFMHPLNSLPIEETFYTLDLIWCKDCSLVQNSTIVKKEVVFPHQYPYLSGTTKILRENFASLCRECEKIIGLGKNDLVVDIGSNDGTLLENFKKSGYRVLGVEPTQAGTIANKKGIPTLIEYFTKETAKKIKQRFGKAKLVTAANVFAHIDGIHSIVEAIISLLKRDGVFVSESHYLLSLIRKNQYDTIYHEHLRYYSVHSIMKLLQMHDLEVFHVKKIPTHGGSIRVYAARKGEYKVSSSVNEFLKKEKKAGLINGKIFPTFKKKIVQSKTELMCLLGKIKNKGARVYGIGAPSRSTTLINYVGIDDSLVDCVMELKGSNKLNKYIPGTRIPVLEESKLFRDKPEYVLIFSWHIAKELISKLKEKGFKGKFIIPLPMPKIVR